MPAEEIQPEVVTPEQVAQAQQQEILPEQVAEEIKPEDKLAESEKRFNETIQSLEEKVKGLEGEKVSDAKRIKDNQEYIARTRKTEGDTSAPEKPQETFDDYLRDIDKLVDDDFDDDPKSGVKKVIRKLATDIAFSRDLERQEMQAKIDAAEDKAFHKAMSLDPERSKTMRNVEKFDEENPDMSALPIERKLEWMSMRSSKNVQAEANTRIQRETDLASDVGSGSSGKKAGRMPAWVNDPKIMADAAQSGFKSKQDLLEWADPETARRKSEAMTV